MQHYQTLEGLQLAGAWVTVGTFDGIHRGHHALLAEMAAGAHDAGYPAVVVTFYPHPAVVLRGLETPYYLTTPDERAELIGQAGVDIVITLEFTPALAALSAREFMQLLLRHLNLRQLWAGFNFALGRNREGTLPALQQLGIELGYSVHIIDPVSLGDKPVSSSQVRALLAEGQVRAAAEQLGRLYSVEGPVVHGDARGRTIGFPTANIQVWPEKILPANGIYACWALLDGQRLPAATNIGVRPTFGSLPPLPRVEAFLIDFHQDIYNRPLGLQFVERLRPEERFASVDALIAQIHADVQHTTEVLADEP
jgi:riboflavin kinase/FMN adenylyltransferase